MINLGSKQSPKNVNLGLGYTAIEHVVSIKLFKQYKDMFTWTYDDLKTYDMKIIQHVILMEPNAKPYQWKLRKMNPKLEPSIKKELNELLGSKIIFPTRHSRWVANLVLVRKRMEKLDFA